MEESPVVVPIDLNGPDTGVICVGSGSLEPVVSVSFVVGVAVRVHDVEEEGMSPVVGGFEFGADGARDSGGRIIAGVGEGAGGLTESLFLGDGVAGEADLAEAIGDEDVGGVAGGEADLELFGVDEGAVVEGVAEGLDGVWAFAADEVDLSLEAGMGVLPVADEDSGVVLPEEACRLQACFLRGRVLGVAR